jgi:hypothetical protein
MRGNHTPSVTADMIDHLFSLHFSMFLLVVPYSRTDIRRSQHRHTCRHLVKVMLGYQEHTVRLLLIPQHCSSRVSLAQSGRAAQS